jgi:hypothetical protein
MAKISAARGKFAARRDLTCFFGLPEAHRRNLPTTQNPDSRLSLLYLAGLGGFPDQTNPSFSTRGVSDPGIGSKWTSCLKGLHYKSYLSVLV